MKKITTRLVAVIIVLSLIPVFNTAIGAQNTPSGWALESVNRAIELGLVPNTLQTSYDRAVTRAEFCALAVRVYETVMDETLIEISVFTDCMDFDVGKMAAIGVVSGIGNGLFAPNNTLTREQAAVILSNLMKVLGYSLTEGKPTFSDSSSVATWASNQVGQMQSSGIMSGVGNNKFEPKGAYTIEQSIVTLLKAYDMASK